MDKYKRPVKMDCEELLGRFQETTSVRYEEFSILWRDMNFSSIFYGRMELNEKRAFSRLILSTASPYLSPPYTFQIRVGALYLLYGLYHSQLSTPKEKIRLALKDWEDVKRFQQDAVNAQHFDVVYILRKLLSDKAFHFTALPKLLYFKEKRTQGRPEQALCEEFVDRSSRPQELISAEMLEELANVHEHYEGLKAAISPEPDQPDPGISLVHQNLVPKLRHAVVSYYNWQKSQTEGEMPSDGGDRDADEGTSNQEACSRRAQILASIKSKSYGQAVEASKSRRHRQVELNSAANEGERSRKVPRDQPPNPSLKQRTVQRHINTGDVNEEDLKLTRLWDLCAVKQDVEMEEKKTRQLKRRRE